MTAAPDKDTLTHKATRVAKKAQLTAMAAVNKDWREAKTALADAEKEGKGWLHNMITHIVREPEPVMRILRTVAPTITFDNYAIVTRFDDVTEVMERTDVFPVPFGPRMEEMTDGQNVSLGMNDSPTRTTQMSMMWLAQRREDVPTIGKPMATRLAKAAMDKAAAERKIDVCEMLLRRVPIGIMRDYYGIPIKPEEEGPLADWLIGESTYIFGNPTDDPDIRARALEQGPLIKDIVARAYDEWSSKVPDGSIEDQTQVLPRLLMMQKQGIPGTNRLNIIASLIGMMDGFMPACSMTAANGLLILWRNRDKFEAAREAALDDNDRLLWRYWFEALRWRPLNPGAFRTCAEDYVVGRGHWRSKKIKKGTLVLASLASARMDGNWIENAHDWDLQRPVWSYMHYGYGMHFCFGAELADAQIVACLKALLTKKNPRPVGGKTDDSDIVFDGPFPKSWMWEWDE